jgi:hypothetical protein
MLEPRPTSFPAAANWAGYLLVATRFVAGYIAAVAAGAILFAALVEWSSPTSASAGKFLELALICFVLGLIFAAPYTVAACLALKFLLPRSRLVFMAIGMLCPAATILTAQFVFDATLWPTRETLKILLMTIPVGMVAALIFGAVGLGRWRFQ